MAFPLKPAPLGARPNGPGQRDQKSASFTRTNYKIRVPEVRVVDATGKMLGLMPTRKAQALAESLGLDLVEITPSAQPPICKIMDYGKFRYQESIKQKEARKNAKATQVKEIKFHAGTDVGDVDRKVKDILGFIAQGNKVKVSLKFRGRENAHKELGIDLINRIIETCGEKISVEQEPKLLGRDLSCLIGPPTAKSLKAAQAKKKAAEGAVPPPAADPAEASAPKTGLSRPI